MLTSFEVGAVFMIEDRASAVLGELGAKFERLDATIRATKEALDVLGKDSLAGLQGGLDRVTTLANELTARARAIGEGFTTGLGEAGAAFTRTIEQIDGISAAYVRAQGAADAFGTAARAAAAGASMGTAEAAAIGYGAGRTGGGAAGGGHGGDIHPGIPIYGPGGGGGGAGGGGGGGGHHPGMFSGGLLAGTGQLAEVGAAYISGKQAMAEDLAIRNTLLEAFHLHQGTPEFQAGYERLRQIAKESSEGTIFDESEVAVAMPHLARELGFTGQEGIEKFSQIFRPSLQAAEVAKMSHLGGLKDSLQASVEYAHMTGAYDPAELEKHLNVLRSIAQLTGRSMHSQEQILKYSVPIGIASGIDADQTAIATGFLQQQGFNSTTAGTGLSAVILGALNTGGGINAHLESARKSLESQLRADLSLKPHEHVAPRGSEHVRALHDLGIVNAAGHLTTVDAKGNFDLHKLEEDIFKYSQTHTHQTVLDTLHAAFGTRGERVAAIFTEHGAITREQRFAHAVETSPSAREIQQALAQSPMQQFEQMLANLANIGNTLASETLPGLNAAFKTMNALLIGVNNFLREHQGISEALGYGGLGVAAGGLLGTGSWLWSKAKGLFGVTGAPAGAAAATGAASGFMRTLGGLGLFVGLTKAAGDEITEGTDWLTDKIWGAGTAEQVHKSEQAGQDFLSGLVGIGAAKAAPKPFDLPSTATKSDTGKTDSAAKVHLEETAVAPKQPSSINVHVGPISMSGVADENTFNNLLARIKDSIKDALTTSSGAGEGSDQSSFVVFGGT